MPGRRPIDIGQHSADRGILKRNTTGIIHNLKEENLAHLASKENSLGQFAPTTSEELAGIITNESGSGSLIFGTNPILIEPVINTIKIDTTSKIITASLITGSTATVNILSFPLYKGFIKTDDYNIVGSVEFIVQTEVGNTTGITTPTKVTKRKITKILSVFNHDFENINIAQNPSYNFTEYGNTYITTSDFALYTVAYNGANEQFEFRVSPLLTNTMYHRVTALCTLGIDKAWSVGFDIS